MSQISAGTANVTNGNNIVQLPGADLSGVVSGHAFHVRGVDAVYSVIAAAPAASPPTVTLSVNYAGITATGVEYRITTGFSPNNSLYEPDAGDVDIPMLLKHRLVRAIDGGLNGSTRNVTEIDGDLWITSNAIWSGTEWHRENTAKYAFALNLRGNNLFPGEAEQGAALWVAQPGANPINPTFGSVGGWELGFDITAFRDMVVGGYGIEIDGHGTLPYGRVIHALQGSEVWTGILTNWFVDLSTKDTASAPGWFIGRADDSFAIKRTPGSSSTWEDLFSVDNAGAATWKDGSIQVGTTYTTPEAHGAKYDGTDDTTALTAALNNGDHIFLKPGRTYSTNGLTITDRNRIKIFGGGTLKLRDGANASLLKLVSVYRSDIDNIMLDGNKAGQTSGYCHGIEGIDFLFGTVKNCKIYECRNTGLYVYAASVYTDETQLTGNYIDFCGGFGLVISGTGDHIVKGNHVKFNEQGNIWLTGVYNCTVEGNQVLSSGLDRYTFAVTGQGRGILIESSRNVIVSGNQARANTQEGIEIYNSPACTVQGNICQYNSMIGVNSHSGILIYGSDNCLVTGNQSSDNAYAVQSAPFNVRHQQYGLKIDGNSLNAMVTGNNFTAADNATGAALITSGSTYRSSCNVGLADA